MSCPHCRRRFSFRRGVRKASWVIPGIMLVLMPKCPLCLAAYIALATGISIPFHMASWLRTALIIGCVASLTWFVTRQLLNSCGAAAFRRPKKE